MSACCASSVGGVGDGDEGEGEDEEGQEEERNEKRRKKNEDKEGEEEEQEEQDRSVWMPYLFVTIVREAAPTPRNGICVP